MSELEECPREFDSSDEEDEVDEEDKVDEE